MTIELLDFPSLKASPRREDSKSKPFKFITIYHPFRGHVFLNLPCYPTGGAQAPVGGHLGTVLTGCQVIANNEPGFLSCDQAGEDKVPDTQPDNCLPPGQYFYHVNREDIKNYPICLDFAAWQPPKVLPPAWQALGAHFDLHLPANIGGSWTAVSNYIKGEDKNCLVTGTLWALHRTLLVPREYRQWFDYHRIWHSADDVANPNIHSQGNIITLHAPLNTDGLDKSLFVFTIINNTFSVYFIGSDTPDLAQRHNYQKVLFPSRVRLYYLYCRFAYNFIKRAAALVLVPAQFNVVSTPVDLKKSIGGTKRRRTEPSNAEGTLGAGTGGRGAGHAVFGGPSDGMDCNDSEFASGTETSVDDTPDIMDLSDKALDIMSQLDDYIKEAVGPTLDSNNLHLLPAQFCGGDHYYPGFSDVARRKRAYLESHPEVRSVRNARIGTFHDRTASDSEDP